jgi:hypothetical protein
MAQLGDLLTWKWCKEINSVGLIGNYMITRGESVSSRNLVCGTQAPLRYINLIAFNKTGSDVSSCLRLRTRLIIIVGLHFIISIFLLSLMFEVMEVVIKAIDPNWFGQISF